MNINEKLQAVMKSMTSADLGESKLNPEQADKFLKVLANASPVLDSARRLPMASHTRHIDRIAFGAQLVKASEGTEIAAGANSITKTNKLIVEEYGMVQPLNDTTIEDSIDQLDNVIVELMGNQAGYDMEVFGLTKWLALAENQVDATAIVGVDKVMDAAIVALPQKYDRNRAALKFFVGRDFEDAYRSFLVERNTNLGDTAVSGSAKLQYKGIELVVVPAMPAGKAILVDPNNLVYGVYRDIRIEEDRNAKARKTDFVLSLRADFNYENEEAAVVVNNIQ